MQNYGQRIKEEARKRKWTSEHLAEFLGCHEKTVSRYYNDRLHMPDEYIKELAKEWAVRMEYLKCEDDWRTEEEMWEMIQISNQKGLQLRLDYLRHLGISCEPKVISSISSAFICRNKEKLRDYLAWDSLATIEDSIDLSVSYDLALSDDELTEKYGLPGSLFVVTWRRNPFDQDSYLDDMTSKKKPSVVNLDAAQAGFTGKINLSLMYKIKLGSSEWYISGDRLGALFSCIDDHAILGLETYLNYSNR